jgi:hypothetical protein
LVCLLLSAAGFPLRVWKVHRLCELLKPNPPAPSDIINQWTYTGSYVPPIGNERVRINLWLLNGAQPTSGSGDAMIIHSFSFQP